MIAVSPFVDAFIIGNIIKRCIFRDRKLLVVTRYATLTKGDQVLIDKAVAQVEEYASKDRSLEEKVSWRCNERVHAKFMIVDWKKILFGSQNLTRFGGLTGNYELGAAIEDKDLLQGMKSFVSDVLKGCRKEPIYPTL